VRRERTDRGAAAYVGSEESDRGASVAEGRDLFVTGGTGYMGRRLIPALVARGYRVRALARPQSVDRVPAGASPIVADALDPETFAAALRPDDTIVHLVGTPHPGPSKAPEFERVDLASIRASVAAARRAGVSHLVYVSVAQPAPVMRAYVAARAAGEGAIREAGTRPRCSGPGTCLGPGTGGRWSCSRRTRSRNSCRRCGPGRAASAL
jgi:nucleoside-diphosphate-sugar epimerase